MHKAYLLLGSNLGNRHQHLADAELLISSGIGKIMNASSVYESAPWGFTDQPAFLNKVLLIETALLPNDLMQKILATEIQLGRVRKEKWHERIIDIDILFFDDQIIQTDDLTIPHPHLHERRFTLVPLNEIASQLQHPVLKKSIHQLLDECEDDSLVKKINQ